MQRVPVIYIAGVVTGITLPARTTKGQTIKNYRVTGPVRKNLVSGERGHALPVPSFGNRPGERRGRYAGPIGRGCTDKQGGICEDDVQGP